MQKFLVAALGAAALSACVVNLSARTPMGESVTVDGREYVIYEQRQESYRTQGVRRQFQTYTVDVGNTRIDCNPPYVSTPPESGGDLPVSGGRDAVIAACIVAIKAELRRQANEGEGGDGYSGGYEGGY